MMKLHNTYTDKTEEFKPIDGNKVKMYVCGPTVYDYAHLGHARCYITWDVLYRYLKFKGYDVTYCRNVTDVDDKILKKAEKEGKTPEEVSTYWYKSFTKSMEGLNNLKPDIEPFATKTLGEMISIVKDLIKNDYAYEAGGDVYFRVKKFKNYGMLSKQPIDQLESGARVEVGDLKEDPLDFALWKKDEKFGYNSPWGVGRPGWHIECSAMSLKYLGEQFDIHTGGVDHIPTHHENEIAQSKGRTGKIPAKTWMHVEFLQVDNGKMGKSLGNAYTLDQLQEKGIEPLAYKLFCYTAHYRTKLNFTFEIAKSSQIAIDRLRNGYLKHLNGTDIINNNIIEEYKKKFLETINDDLNIPLAMSIIWEIIKSEKKSKQYAELLLDFDRVLGLDLKNSKKYLESKEKIQIPEDIKELIEERKKAREEKNWQLSDLLRDQIKEKGYIVKDTKEGMTIDKI